MFISTPVQNRLDEFQDKIPRFTIVMCYKLQMWVGVHVLTKYSQINK